jgi:hypothetical protein
MDCEVDGEGRKILLIGDVNICSGNCGCCTVEITWVYRIGQLTVPTQ